MTCQSQTIHSRQKNDQEPTRVINQEDDRVEEIGSDSETDSTIDYELSGSEWNSDESRTVSYDSEGSDSEGEEIGAPVVVSRFGRIVKKKSPTDYENL